MVLVPAARRADGAGVRPSRVQAMPPLDRLPASRNLPIGPFHIGNHAMAEGYWEILEPRRDLRTGARFST